MRGIPEIKICRILMFMRPFGALRTRKAGMTFKPRREPSFCATSFECGQQLLTCAKLRHASVPAGPARPDLQDTGMEALLSTLQLPSNEGQVPSNTDQKTLIEAGRRLLVNFRLLVCGPFSWFSAIGYMANAGFSCPSSGRSIC